MVMLVFERMVPWVELEGVYAEFDNVSALPFTVQNISSSVDAFYSCLCVLEATSGLDMGGGAALSINTRSNKNRCNRGNGSVVNGGGEIVHIP